MSLFTCFAPCYSLLSHVLPMFFLLFLQLGPLEEDVLHQIPNTNAAASLQRITEIQSTSSVSFSSLTRSRLLGLYCELKHRET